MAVLNQTITPDLNKGTVLDSTSFYYMMNILFLYGKKISILCELNRDFHMRVVTEYVH